MVKTPSQGALCFIWDLSKGLIARLHGRSADQGVCRFLKDSAQSIGDLDSRATLGFVVPKRQSKVQETLMSQRVQFEGHYGSRSPKPYHIWFQQPEFHNGTLVGPSDPLPGVSSHMPAAAP